MDVDRATSIADIPAGFIDKENELIFGIQNDELFKLNFMPRGGIRMAETTLIENGYTPDPLLHEIYTKHATTVNDGIFRAYTADIRVLATHTTFLVFQMHTHVVVSSVCTLVWHFTVQTT